MMRYHHGPLHVLVVEDNPGDRMLLEAYLGQSRLKVGHVQLAATLQEATQLVHHPFDVAFLDLTLPDSSGVLSFSRLQQLLPRTPIIVLSGMADEALALKCIALGAQDYLLKDDLNEKLLERSVNYSIERARNLEKLSDINRQYELIGSITHDIIWYWDLKHHTVTAHKESFWGYGPGEVGTTVEWWLAQVHASDYEKMCAVVTGVMDGTLDNLQIEYRFRCKDGSYRYVFNRGVLVRDGEGAPGQMVGAMMDITERKQLQEELLQAQVHLQRQITEATILGQEREKEAIGKELHDNINQVLASARLYLDMAVDPGMREEMIRRSRNNLVYAMEEIRRLSHSLIPPSLDDHGLIDSVRELGEELERVGVFSVHLVVEGLGEGMLSENRKLMLYRVVQEALNNIVKYAQATEVTITFRAADGQLRLEIADNGTGFDPAKKSKGVGLRNIETRVTYYAGTVHLLSAPGAGTTLRVILPLDGAVGQQSG